MSEQAAKPRIPWYRCPVPREELKKLNRRSDLKGGLQTVGFLAYLAATGVLAGWAITHGPWPAAVAAVFFHGMGWQFLLNGFHELVHESVFRTRWLNAVFLRIYSFLGWYNHHHFWASHMEHHKYTLHQPDDLEVVLPMPLTLRGFLMMGFVNAKGFYVKLRDALRLAMGKVEGRWTLSLFPPSQEQDRRRLIRWARILLIGHGAIVAGSLALGWWWLPLLTTLAPFYGAWLHHLCNISQHAGLCDSVPDFRLCCRTVILNPYLRFLYWHMNYHTEHHMYAAVPCYNLGRLHALVKDDMPYCPRGLIATCKQIIDILRRQKVEPGYQYMAELPPTATPARLVRREDYDRATLTAASAANPALA